mmetsp:Transcript_34526/g.89418  ORF Transcript_34526/g.89418 Transcript_34526/m.89418 type:complete len:304 (+) Transcript_34526:663-1574(+)
MLASSAALVEASLVRAELRAVVFELLVAVSAANDWDKEASVLCLTGEAASTELFSCVSTADLPVAKAATLVVRAASALLRAVDAVAMSEESWASALTRVGVSAWMLVFKDAVEVERDVSALSIAELIAVSPDVLSVVSPLIACVIAVSAACLDVASDAILVVKVVSAVARSLVAVDKSDAKVASAVCLAVVSAATPARRAVNALCLSDTIPATIIFADNSSACLSDLAWLISAWIAASLSSLASCSALRALDRAASAPFLEAFSASSFDSTCISPLVRKASWWASPLSRIENRTPLSFTRAAC